MVILRGRKQCRVYHMKYISWTLRGNWKYWKWFKHLSSNFICLGNIFFSNKVVFTVQHYFFLFVLTFCKNIYFQMNFWVFCLHAIGYLHYVLILLISFRSNNFWIFLEVDIRFDSAHLSSEKGITRKGHVKIC